MNSKRMGCVGVLVGVFALLNAPFVLAATTLSRGYLTKEAEVSVGAIVSRTDGDLIGLASAEDSERLMGVISTNALMEVSDDQRQVQVATSGRSEVLVSTINGDIKAGDRIASSPIKGLGMKASESGYVLGTAAADFSSAKYVTDREVVDKSGAKVSVKVGLLPIDIATSYYEKKQNQSLVPQFIVNIAKAVAGREVSVARVLAAAAVLAVGLAVVVVLIASTARSSIISIGRNPLAAKAVHRGLLEASGIALGILLVMLIAVYLILVI